MYDLDGQVGEDCETLQDDIEEEYVLYNDPVYNWTATRAAVGSNLGMFLDSDIENKRFGKTILKQWRKYQKQEFAIDKNQTIPLRMRDAIKDKVQMEVDLQN